MRLEGSNPRTWIAVLGTLAVLFTVHHHGLGQEKTLNAEVKASARITKPDADGKQIVTLTVRINKGWYIYANPVKNDMDVYKNNQTTVRVKAQGTLSNVKIHYPAGELHEELGQKYLIYHDTATIEVMVQRTAGDVSPLEVDLNVSTCHMKDMVCLPKGHTKFILP